METPEDPVDCMALWLADGRDTKPSDSGSPHVSVPSRGFGRIHVSGETVRWFFLQFLVLLFHGRRGATRQGATDASAVLPRPPPEARAQHRDSLKAAGYEDIDDFANFDTKDLSVFKDALQKLEVPPGHIQKIVKAIQKLQHKPVRATDGDSRQCQGTTSPSAASPSAASPSAPFFQSPAVARGVDRAAEQAGQAAALHETSKHSAKGMAWLNTTAGRVIYGRHKPHVKLTAYQNNGDGSGSNGGGVGGGLMVAVARRGRRQRRRLGQWQRRRARRRRWRRR